MTYYLNITRLFILVDDGRFSLVYSLEKKKRKSHKRNQEEEEERGKMELKLEPGE